MFSTQKMHSDEAIQRAQLLIEERLARSLSVADLARAAAVSTRTFVRRFRSATGNGPREYIQRVRIEAAKRALESEAAPSRPSPPASGTPTRSPSASSSSASPASPPWTTAPGTAPAWPPPGWWPAGTRGRVLRTAVTDHRPTD
jgi:AraC-like DNA-binding protein